MNKQSDLFASLDGPRDGVTFVPERDEVRLNKQQHEVFDAIKDGRWRTLAGISQRTGHPQASVSARLRDLRKPRFGGHTVERRYVGNGLHEYRLKVPLHGG